MSSPQPELERKLGWLILALLLAGCLFILRPFLSSLLWAAILSFSSWPLYCRVLRWVRGRRMLAALLVSGGMVGTILVPAAMVGLTLKDNVRDLTTATQRWIDEGPPPPPAWIARVPVVGPDVARYWKNLGTDGGEWMGAIRRLLEPASAWLLHWGLRLGQGLFHLALSILVTFLLLRNGPVVARTLTDAVERIAQERGKRLLLLAGTTVRGVVYGILGTALVQGLLAGVGLLVAGVPGPAVLAMLVFFLSVVPGGPLLVMLPAVLWLFHQQAGGWAVFMLIWGVGVSTVDNFVRPWLISQGSDIPFVLILFGVLGGAFAFGLVGIFIGPTLLAVGHRILAEWVQARRTASPRIA